MVYESSYESGRLPFRPDLKRGKWDQPTDFIYACLGFAYKLDIFSASWFFFFELGATSIVPYLLCVGIYIVPSMVVQSFMGQFSSSGFISAFRISPFFKGMGYVSLALNTSMLVYYNIFAAIPLIFIFNSLRPTLPWSCEVFEELGNHFSNDSNMRTICNITERAYVNETENYDDENYTSIEYVKYELPSVLYFRTHFKSIDFYDKRGTFDFELSWVMVGLTLLIWTIISYIFYKYFETEKLGKLLRYTIWTLSGLLALCFTRFMFLEGAFNGMAYYFQPNIDDLFFSIPSIPVVALQAFGSGFGVIIALSSFNSFKTDIMKYSWIICLGQMLIFMMFGMCSYMLMQHFQEFVDKDYYGYMDHRWMFFLSGASAISTLSLSNFWCIVFYSMLLIAALLVMVTQIFAILRSIFDEFEILRAHKQEVTFGFIGVLALSSLYFCSNHGVMHAMAISVDTLVTQTILYLLLLLVMLWIYGRERFQRDIEFMLNQRFATWKVNMMRFVAPLCMLFTLTFIIFISAHEHQYSAKAVKVLAIFLIYLPLLAIPSYGIYLMFQMTGTNRFRRSCRPNDWYPAEMEDRQHYEDAMGNATITHQLNEVTEDCL